MKKLFASILLAITSLSCFADWPTKPVTIIVPYQVGGQATNISNAFQLEIEKQYPDIFYWVKNNSI